MKDASMYSDFVPEISWLFGPPRVVHLPLRKRLLVFFQPSEKKVAQTYGLRSSSVSLSLTKEPLIWRKIHFIFYSSESGTNSSRYRPGLLSSVYTDSQNFFSLTNFWLPTYQSFWSVPILVKLKKRMWYRANLQMLCYPDEPTATSFSSWFRF